MSKHHHHPHEGHSAGNPPGSGKRLRHSPFFYVAGVFILIGLICFILWGTFGRSTVVTAPPAVSTK